VSRAAPGWLNPAIKHPKLRAALYPELPGTALYHYTDQAGLLGILMKKEIWATHTQYLNDEEEYKHALERFQQCVKLKVHEAATLPIVHALEGFAKKAPRFPKANVCVSSFSEKPDSLSQWRAYGAPGSAFAIGFNAESLAKIADAQKIYLARCIYSEADQATLLDLLVEDCVTFSLALTAAAAKKDISGALELLNVFAPIMKNAHFRDEHEWRFIARRVKPKELDFRRGRSSITPYKVIPLAGVKIDEIVVGPTPSRDLSRDAVEQFALKFGHLDTRVRNTHVPFRSW